MTLDFTAYRRQWFTDGIKARRDVLASIVVALALIPEAIGFSIIAGVDPRVGLYASVAIAMTISLVGGRPGMISAATAAVAVLVGPLVREHGVEYLFAATILMGVIQIVAGVLRRDLVMQFVSRSVISCRRACRVSPCRTSRCPWRRCGSSCPMRSPWRRWDCWNRCSPRRSWTT